MIDIQQKIAIGGMLHDIGKVLFRAEDGRNHSISGYEFLKDVIGIEDDDILDQVRYHHSALLKNAKLPENAAAYITYMADNIAAASDRREKDDGQSGFDKEVPLESVFDILCGERPTGYYSPATMERTGSINSPKTDPPAYTSAFYIQIKDALHDILYHLKAEGTIENHYINSLLEVLEANLSFVPSSTSGKERADISLYDHMKLTAALGNCIYAFLEEQKITDYNEALFKNGSSFYGKKAFLLLGLDMSGIQAFIYHQYGTGDVLKNLRARSFYLEIMMENMIDELLELTGLSRANLIYCGGGHAYLLLPNTGETRETVDRFLEDADSWLLEEYGSELYLAGAYEACSADTLKNEPPGAYTELFQTVSGAISTKKMHRYSADGMRYLNRNTDTDGERECRICHRSDRVDEDGLCEACSGLTALSNDVLEKSFFSVEGEKKGSRLALYKNRFLNADTFDSLKKRIRDSQHYIRAYGKNEMYTGDSVATRLWVGDYHDANTLEQLVERGEGIRRLGVLRADVDNLGQAFVRGFPERYQTLSRSATFSRQLSLFFKLHINDILEHPEYSLDGAEHPRHVSVVYSGGDDLFIMGAWKDVLEFAVDLYHRLREFSQGALTISAGYGLYQPKYPVSYIARQTGALESNAKRMDGKNAITLFSHGHTYHWTELIEKVLDEKFALIRSFFQTSDERGKNYLYNLLDLYRSGDKKIHLARLAYYLARLEPDKDADEQQKESYREFAKKIYAWYKSANDRKQVITAIYLYAYLIREGGEE